MSLNGDPINARFGSGGEADKSDDPRPCNVFGGTCPFDEGDVPCCICDAVVMAFVSHRIGGPRDGRKWRKDKERAQEARSRFPQEWERIRAALSPAGTKKGAGK